MFRPDIGDSPQGCENLRTLFNKHMLGVHPGQATQGTLGSWESLAQARVREFSGRKQTLKDETSWTCQK